MTSTHRIAFLLFDGFEIIDHAGPSSVFATVGSVSDAHGSYHQEMFSLNGGLIRAGSGLQVMTRATPEARGSRFDTLFVVGANGPELRRALREGEVTEALTALMPNSRRVASICTGAFILAATGALTGRAATTHWEGRRQLAEGYPAIRVTEDALYVRDGRFWTAGGATAGIDMALAMLREDHGNGLVRAVAQRLLLYAHRPGNQSQFSALLSTQASVSTRFSDVIGWLNSAALAGVNVAVLAERAGMTERTFYRKFTQETGLTPARYLERVRLARARSLLEQGLAVAAIAEEVGFRSQSGFRAAFEARFGVSPSVYRALQSATGTLAPPGE